MKYLVQIGIITIFCVIFLFVFLFADGIKKYDESFEAHEKVMEE